jgi:outer membrane receptor protein involved in Fe transport
LRYTSPRLRAATYFYHYRINDLIERYSTSTDFFFFRNRGRAELRGFEAEAQATLGWGLSLESAFQIARGRALDDDTYLDDIAPVTVSVQVRKALPFRDAFVQARTAVYGDDDRPGPTEREVPGYTMFDAAGGLSLIEALELRITARNLLNQSYLASQDVRTVAAPGRSVSASLVVRLGG